MINIDTNFNFQIETLDKNGKDRDSDKYSPTLQEYHRQLWSKQLPSGAVFNLTKISDNRLYHESQLGKFYLSSDWGVATFSNWQRTKTYMSDIDFRMVKDFDLLVITIGARIIWPSNKINGLPTINGARGMSYYVADRLDLTLECIRRYYNGETNPLNDTFKRYDDFFNLFVNFKGYTDFFLLQDYVNDSYNSVNIAQPFANFETSPVPSTKSEYLEYMKHAIKLVNARNIRIADHASGLRSK